MTQPLTFFDYISLQFSTQEAKAREYSPNVLAIDLVLRRRFSCVFFSLYLPVILISNVVYATASYYKTLFELARDGNL